MTFREYMEHNIVYFDGGVGSILQSKCLLPPNAYAETLYITQPDILQEIHREYYNAGCNVVSTCTFRTNAVNFPKEQVDEIIRLAVETVKTAQAQSTGSQEKFIALEYGPIGKLLRPYGTIEFEEAVELFAQIVRAGVRYGVDLLSIETMNDSLETKAAVLAAKENSTLPVLVSNTYGEDGKLITGASPAAMAVMLEGLGADIIGANCALGPKQMKPVVEELLRYSSVPVFVKPNAGLPRSVDGLPVYDVTPEEFADEVTKLLESGVRHAGGCCGTTPEYLRILTERSCRVKPLPLVKKNQTCISSCTHTVSFDTGPVLIGECINPTGKALMKQALQNSDLDYILTEGIAQQDCGAHVLDVNVSLPEINEPVMLDAVIQKLQTVTDLPLQIDSVDPAALEIALRHYNGKALVNSVNGSAKSIAAVFPLIKKYGGVVIALTLDETGIPVTASGRLHIAEKILNAASQYGIESKNIIFDPLALAASTFSNAANVTLEALRLIQNKVRCHTCLGISNISFGLPDRTAVNRVFFSAALENGLSAAILNPKSADMMKTYYAYRALHNQDKDWKDYLAFCKTSESTTLPVLSEHTQENDATLRWAIANGMKERAGSIVRELLKTMPAFDIVHRIVIPALDSVAHDFEEERTYLPQLMMSAEAAKSAFQEIKYNLSQNGETHAEKCDFVLASVKGDIHDIGKNIVHLLVENYGFAVTDLGIDVPPEKIVDAVSKINAPIVGLSALMTTTIPAMEETICLLREKGYKGKIIVGGAVLNHNLAKKIGADYYAKDAMETVRYANAIWENM